MPNTKGLIEELTAKNEDFRKAGYPFNRYYPYYRLARKFESGLKIFLKESHEKFSNFLSREFPLDSEGYLCFESDTVENDAKVNLREFLRGILRIVDDEKAQEISMIGFDREKIKAIKHNYVTRDKKRIIQVSLKKENKKEEESRWSSLLEVDGKNTRKIRLFWYSVRACDPRRTDNPVGHVGIDFLDLLAACCGYSNFHEFLKREFWRKFKLSNDVYKKLDKDMPDERRIPPEERNRLQEKEELIREVEEIGRKTFNSRPKEPATTYPDKPIGLLGRRGVLEDVGRMLFKHKALILNGVRGIGKSSVASAYYWEVRDAKEKRYYSDIVWVPCAEGIYAGLAEFAHHMSLHLDGLRDDQKARALLNYLSEEGRSTLLILDEANSREELGRSFRQHSAFDLEILWVTSCNDFPEDWPTYTLEPLSPVDAVSLFNKYQTEDSRSEAAESVESFLRAVSSNTLLIEIFSKQAAREWKFGRSFKQFLEQIETQGLFLSDSAVTIETNYMLSKTRTKSVATVGQILDVLYDNARIEKSYLRPLLVNLALLPDECCHLNFLKDLLDPSEFPRLDGDLLALHEEGWIVYYGEQKFGLQPIFRKSILKKNRDTLGKFGKGLFQNALKKKKLPLFSGLLTNFIKLLREANGDSNRDLAQNLSEEFLS